MDLIKRLAELQEHFVNICVQYGIDYSDSNLIVFEHNGTNIINPFVDETARFEVDPFEYYGESFKNSEWMKYL